MLENVSGNTPEAMASQEVDNAQAQFISNGEVQNEQEPAEQKTQQFDEARFREIAREEAIRAAQSQSDKATDRITKMIREKIDALEKVRREVGLSDEQVETAKRKIVDDARYSLADEQPAAVNQSETQQTQQKLHPIVAEALDIMDRYGVRIEEGDPEFEKYLKPHFKKPNLDISFRDDAIIAVREKMNRLAEQKSNAAVRAPGGAPGSKVPANDISNITDTKQLYIMGDKRLRGDK